MREGDPEPQPRKAERPIVVKLDGSVREVRPLHPLNAESPMMVQESGSVREVRTLQPRHTALLILTTAIGEGIGSDAGQSVGQCDRGETTAGTERTCTNGG